MRLDTSQNVKKSSLHTLPIVTACEFGPNSLMGRSIASVAARLVATQRALELSPAELCRLSGIPQNAWTHFTDPKYGRKITITHAFKLKDTWGIPIEWVYDGDARWLPAELRDKLRKMKAVA
jgi:hypothetical protein